MTLRRVSSGSTFEIGAAYSRAVIDGDYVFVAGTTGYDYQTMTISDDVVKQTEQCFVNLAGVLEDAGSSLSDVVRVTYILPDREDFEACWPVLRKYFGDAPPAATMFEARLLNDAMKIEIQVTARLSKS